MELTLESMIIDDLAKQMNASIDFDILCDTLVPFGWSVIEVDYGPNTKWIDVMAWYESNCTGDYKEHKGKWLIHNTEDAILFKLRWA